MLVFFPNRVHDLRNGRWGLRKRPMTLEQPSSGRRCLYGYCGVVRRARLEGIRMSSVHVRLRTTSVDETHPIREFQCPEIRLRTEVLSKSFACLFLARQYVGNLGGIFHVAIGRRVGATDEVSLEDVITLVLSTTNAGQAVPKISPNGLQDIG